MNDNEATPYLRYEEVAWDHVVELGTVGADLIVHQHEMTLRLAVRRFLAMSEEGQNTTGIGLREPVFAMIGDSRVAIGFLNADGIRELGRILLAGE